jgi:glycosyltransferase involved in cell wall biosynthesis
MHGSLRYSLELLNQLSMNKQVNLNLCISKYDSRLINKLNEFALENYNYNESRICNNLFIHNSRFELYNKIINNIIRLLPYINSNLLNKKKLTSINIYHSPIGPIPIQIKRNKKIQSVYTSHDLLPFIRKDLAPILYYNILKPAYDSIDSRTTIIAVSKETRNDLLNYRKDLKENNIKVVYPAANSNIFFKNSDTNLFLKMKLKYKFTFDKYILCLNRVQKYKNTQFVIDSYVSLIDSKAINDIALIVIGKFDSDLIKLEYFTKYRKYNIFFLDYVPDNELSLFYTNATCFVYMSLFEGFGLPVLEAMQCGTPVISSNINVISEVAGDCCILQDPFNKDILCNNILELVKNESLQLIYSKKGLNRSNLFTWEKNCTETINVYNQLIS